MPGLPQRPGALSGRGDLRLGRRVRPGGYRRSLPDLPPDPGIHRQHPGRSGGRRGGPRRSRIHLHRPPLQIRRLDEDGRAGPQRVRIPRPPVRRLFRARRRCRDLHRVPQPAQPADRSGVLLALSRQRGIRG
ncbi:MAG TPA: hypothetical protein ENO14_04205 [Chromatiales bacterium]|nr:hypothetical protein [Chromatiales bacterium]